MRSAGSLNASIRSGSYASSSRRPSSRRRRTSATDCWRARPRSQDPSSFDPGGGSFEPGADASFATLHGLYWLVAALAESEPLLLVVDDAHWADAPSLRFVDFLARRAPELAVAVVVGLRPREPGAEHELIDRLRDAPARLCTRRSCRPRACAS